MDMADEEQQKREAKQRSTNFQAALKHTRDLRRSEEPRWKRLRSTLEQAGVDLDRAAVASKNTEDASLELGIVVIGDGRAFSFEFDWLGDEDGLMIEYEDARVSALEELDQSGREIYKRQLEAGREVLEREASTE